MTTSCGNLRSTVRFHDCSYPRWIWPPHGLRSATLPGSVTTLFFFKQKTAYEMVMSDWSSDVCSSDLHSIGRVPTPAAGLPAERVDRPRSEERRVGKSVHHRVDLGGRRIIKKKKNRRRTNVTNKGNDPDDHPKEESR